MTNTTERFPRPFVLHRREDVSGVSGTGIVAEGVEFSDGTVSLRWTSASPTSVVFHDNGIESVKLVHGHSGATSIVYLDNQIARREADLRDDRDAWKKLAEDQRRELARKEGELVALTVRMENGGITWDEIRSIGDKAWAAVENGERAS